MQSIRKNFPATSHSIYADTAATGLLSDALLEWRHEHDLDYLIGGSQAKMEQLQILGTTKQTVADLFACEVSAVSLIQNFSLGINMLLEGLDRTTKILLIEDDYPSVNWPFERRQFQITFAKSGKDLEQNILEIVEKEQIDVLALSLIQWLSGIKIDLNFLAALKATYPKLIIIADGTQFCGANELDFASSGIDVLGASGYKWLLSGFGNGFMLFKPEVQQRLEMFTTGYYSSGIDAAKKNSFRFAKHFEPGHLDSLNFGSLNFSLTQLRQLGIQEIMAHNQSLMLKAKNEFAALGVLDENVLERDDHSTIFNIKGNAQVYNDLSDNNVVCSQRGAGIRLSFHMYNTLEEIDQISDILKKSI